MHRAYAHVHAIEDDARQEQTSEADLTILRKHQLLLRKNPEIQWSTVKVVRAAIQTVMRVSALLPCIGQAACFKKSWGQSRHYS